VLQTIYVALLNDGIDAWRPVSAKVLSEHQFEILGIVPPDEEWQFTPGTHVRCKETVFADGKTGLVAYEVAL
jgi:hypothetical protein